MARIISVPLTTRIQYNTTHLQRWMTRVSHQAQVSKALLAQSDASQLTLHEAFSNTCLLG
jgi:hypothetical protein